MSRARAEAVLLPAAAGDAISLASLPVGASGQIESVDTDTPAGRRLTDLGFLPGTEVRVVRRAPLGDPSVFELRGYRLCIRRAEADRVRVVAATIPPSP
jgi:ferrous iron transport protein A